MLRPNDFRVESLLFFIDRKKPRERRRECAPACGVAHTWRWRGRARWLIWRDLTFQSEIVGRLRREIARDGGTRRARASRAPLTARLNGREPTDRCMNEAAEISVPLCVCRKFENIDGGDSSGCRCSSWPIPRIRTALANVKSRNAPSYRFRGEILPRDETLFKWARGNIALFIPSRQERNFIATIWNRYDFYLWKYIFFLLDNDNLEKKFILQQESILRIAAADKIVATLVLEIVLQIITSASYC